MTDLLKILVIDDSEDDRILYKRTLQKITDTNYSMLEVDNGEDGLKHIQEDVPAVYY